MEDVKKTFSSEASRTSSEFFLEIFMVEMKAVLTPEIEFEYWNYSFLMELSSLASTINTPIQGSI